MRDLYRWWGKRAFDLTLVIVGSPLWLPLLGLLAVLVRLILGAPVIFRQVRPGLGGKAFTIFKLRSMTQAQGGDGCPFPDDQRLGRFGRFLRSTSFDELPELLNVLRGEMSLVGPRPLLMRYLPLYSPQQARRHEVLPGITGWAQVNGRNALTWEKKFELDVWYVERLSLSLDLRILWRTVRKVVLREGILFAGKEQMPFFVGAVGDIQTGRGDRMGSDDNLGG